MVTYLSILSVGTVFTTVPTKKILILRELKGETEVSQASQPRPVSVYYLRCVPSGFVDII